MATITIPKKLIKEDDLVVISRKEYERLAGGRKSKKKEVTEKDVLKWSREAKQLKKAGKLHILKSLKELR